MAEHSTLTGASLHEPKGADTANSGEVYVADGLGSGNWSDFDEFNAFGGQLLHVRDQRASGSAAQTLTDSTWEKRDLQTTVTNEIASATLTSSVISLPAGTYFLIASGDIFLSRNTVNGSFSGLAKLRFRNTTDGSDLIVGHAHRAEGSNTAGSDTVSHTQGVGVSLPLMGRFTLAGTKNLELQSWVSMTSGTRTGGAPAASGSVEVYTDVMIWKIA